MNKKINNIKNKLLSIIKKPNNNPILRNRKISYKQLFYLYLFYVSSDTSFKYLTIIAQTKFNINISEPALIKRFNSFNYKKIIKINKCITKQVFYNKTENDVKYIAIDGSWLNVSTHLKYDYKKSKDGNYKKILLSCFFDVHNNIPIHYSLDKSNERAVLLNCIDYIPKNSVIIGDRGYFSELVVVTLLNNNIHFIFRLLKSYNIVKNNLIELKKNKKITVTYKNKQLNIFYYNINKNDYFIATSKLNLNINQIKTLYKDRWEVETHFKLLKEYYKFNNINCYNHNHLLNKLYLSQLNILLNEAVNKQIKYDSKKEQINKRMSKKIFNDNLLDFFFVNGKIKKILKIFKLLLYKLQENRTFKRIKKRPGSKWLLTKFKFYSLKK